MPYIIDPANHLRLYLGTHRVYRTTNGAGSWTAISPDLTDGAGGGNLVFGTLTTLAVAPSAPGTVYAGSDDGNVHVTTNDGGSWTEIDAGLPLRWVTRVAVDPLNAAIAYVTFSGYREDDFLSHVFRTTNFGGSWSDISSNLPEAPVNDLVIDPDNTSHLYIATDVGVFATTDLGGSWQVFGTDLPVAVIADLELHAASRTLVAGTHGRSSFKISIDAPVDVPVIAGATGDVLFAAPRPNPSRGPVTLSFSLSREKDAQLTIHDVSGRVVRTLWNGKTDGERSVMWDGRDNSGEVAAAGVYFARLEAEGFRSTKTITLLR
ncbi:MAG TPA: FlgD immunoglobulin-like domain containing protein [bacterium]|nr:FlgD immunoglobulin-like domain containing protein [bacterium]